MAEKDLGTAWKDAAPDVRQAVESLAPELLCEGGGRGQIWGSNRPVERRYPLSAMQNHSSKKPIFVDEALAAKADEVLAAFGATVDDAIRATLALVVVQGGWPSHLCADQNGHDQWFSAKVQQAVGSAEATVPHQQVMDEAQAIIDRSRSERD